jgi:hypothetical protein
MVMMRVGKAALSAKQIDEMMTMYPGTQIFDPSGYWKPERIRGPLKNSRRMSFKSKGAK